MSTPYIQEGDSAIFDVNDGERRSFQFVKAKGDVKMGKARCSLEPLVGERFGTVFELSPDGQGLQVMALEKEKDPAPNLPRDLQDRNNSNILDDGSAQALTSEDIERMKAEGMDPQEILRRLQENSASWGKKTEFSQAKYVKKKMKKYAPKLRVVRPTAATICDVYFEKQPMKICKMRSDTLSQLLGLANVGAHQRTLVVDATGGLVTGAAADRGGGFGNVVHCQLGRQKAVTDVVRLFNFPPHVLESIILADLDKLLRERKDPGGVIAAAVAKAEAEVAGVAGVAKKEGGEGGGGAEEGEGEGEGGAKEAGGEGEGGGAAPMQEEGAGEGAAAAEGAVEAAEGGGGGGAGAAAAAASEEGGHGAKGHRGSSSGKISFASPAQLTRWGKVGFSGLIIANPNLDPRAACDTLLPLLEGSAPFVVYHTSLQPLAECMAALQQSRAALGLQLHESWMREYQVLPSRTHPTMSTSATGGYLMAGFKADASHQPQANKKQRFE